MATDLGSTNDFTPSELMVSAAARELRDGEVVFVGIGLPNLACNLARRLHAPNLVLIYESGAVGAVPERIPVSIGDPALVTNSIAVASMSEIFYNYLQGGKIDVGFLQGAQIDRCGNLNTTVIGDYAHPKVRLPGSGGACEIAINARRVLCIAAQSKKSFPAKIDFVTSPGHLAGPATRERSSECAAPARSASSPTSRSTTSTPARCASPASTPASPSTASANPRLGAQSRPRLATTPPPTAEELHLLRHDLDPKRLYL